MELVEGAGLSGLRMMMRGLVCACATIGANAETRAIIAMDPFDRRIYSSRVRKNRMGPYAILKDKGEEENARSLKRIFRKGEWLE